MKKNIIASIIKVILLSCATFCLSLTNLQAQKIKVFILAGQSNMEGQGDILPGNISGTLSHFMDEGGDEQFEYIRDNNGDWATRNDVWVRYDNENGALITEALNIGFGADENKIGPELGFGHLLGEFSEDQVLIIKTSWGGKNLAVDFRPPSSGGVVGPFYNKMIADVNTAIGNIAVEFPAYAGQEIEIAGMCWFQGWNDGESESFLNEYEANLINLIADVRTDLNVSDLPVVIGLTGHGGFDDDHGDTWVLGLQNTLVPAQINAAQFAGHTQVNYADTREFWPATDQSPEPDFIHHWSNNGESFLRIGTELGRKMIELLDPSSTAGVYTASNYGFNYFSKEFIPDNNFGAGYSFYSAVYSFLEQYPGYENFQSGVGTWLTPQETENNVNDFYNTIEGGLGWWGDTRFGTATPKFIMGGVAHDFDAWANGPGAGSSDNRIDGHRDWDIPGGKYGIAQLSPNLLWPPDGLNMEQGANGAFLGYGYHPLPLTDPIQTNGSNFTTGNQCWTLFMNTTNFKGPVAFFIPTFWTSTIGNDPTFEGLFLDTRPSDPNLAFAQEYSASPALVGVDDVGDIYARIIPPTYPKTNSNSSALLRDVSVYSRGAKWNEVENWFNGGAIATTTLNTIGTREVDFNIDNAAPAAVDAGLWTDEGPVVDILMNQSDYAKVKMSADGKVGLFEWDTNIVEEVDNGFKMPTFYKKNQSNEWEAIPTADVPPSSGLLDNEPAITPRNEDLPYLSPLEPDCHIFGTVNPWNSPGPATGPFTVSLGDGSQLTYYWYRFIDQPSIIHANLPEAMRQNLQERIEKIHTNWKHTDEYLASPSGGTLVGLDAGLIVTPPAGMEIGYVPIVTRQQKAVTPCADNQTINEDMDNLIKLVEANKQIISDKKIKGNSVVTFTTGEQISLLPGFEVENGASFLATIGSCTNSDFISNNENSVNDSAPLSARNLALDNQATAELAEQLTISPNPFIHQTTITYSLSAEKQISMQVVDVLGQPVATLIHNEIQSAGNYEVPFLQKALQSGTYFVILRQDGEYQSQKLLILE